METADTCRQAAIDAIADVEPPRLQAIVERVLDGASMVPGGLTLESAAAVGGDAHEQALTHAAGVQLIYEGLNLTRQLAQAEPWTEATGDTDADLEILAADILVARGFYLLARTEAADTAVRTVQAFGRAQTEREELADEPDPSEADLAAIDATLERDVLDLAVDAGVAATDEPPATHVQTLAEEIGQELTPGFPPLETYHDRLQTVSSEPSLEELPTDAATSATDS